MVGRFGEFELHRHIGCGGMADVYAARRPTDMGPSVCAIKVIRQEGAQDPNYRKLFLTEGKLAMRLCHGNLVSVFDVGEHAGSLFMVMELIDGVSLDDYLRRVRSRQPDRPNLGEAIHITGELLRALHHVHTYEIDEVNQRIVHGDVSPQNVLVTSSGEIKLTDFGIARVLDGHNTSRVYGKLGYMPREQYEGSPVQQSDLFAVGAILYEILTNRRLRAPCLNHAELHAAIMQDGPPKLPRGLPSELREVLVGLLEPEPTRRTQSAKEALRQLGNHLRRGDLHLDLEELYLDCVGSRHSWYTDLTRQAQAASEATTSRKAGRGRGGKRGKRAPIKARLAEHEQAGRKWSRVTVTLAPRGRPDAAAPAPGRPWELARGHDVAVDDMAVDEVTTAPWGRRRVADQNREVRP